MNAYNHIKLKVDKNIFNAIIEIPKGSPIKYEHDKETGLFFLDRVHYSSFMTLPADYGYFPQTLADDGDPLDAIVISSFPIHMGVVVPVQVLGHLDMIDSGKPDEKVIAKVENDMMLTDINSIRDINKHFKNQIEQYFKNYKELKNKKVEIGSWHDNQKTFELIEKFHKQYIEKK